MKTQIWFCRVCERRGQVKHEEGADARGVTLQVTGAHAIASPGCPDSNVQVVNDERISPDEASAIAELELVTSA